MPTTQSILTITLADERNAPDDGHERAEQLVAVEPVSAGEPDAELRADEVLPGVGGGVHEGTPAPDRASAAADGADRAAEDEGRVSRDAPPTAGAGLNEAVAAGAVASARRALEAAERECERLATELSANDRALAAIDGEHARACEKFSESGCNAAIKAVEAVENRQKRLLWNRGPLERRLAEARQAVPVARFAVFQAKLAEAEVQQRALIAEGETVMREIANLAAALTDKLDRFAEITSALWRTQRAVNQQLLAVTGNPERIQELYRRQPNRALWNGSGGLELAGRAIEALSGALISLLSPRASDRVQAELNGLRSIHALPRLPAARERLAGGGLAEQWCNQADAAVVDPEKCIEVAAVTPETVSAAANQASAAGAPLPAAGGDRPTPTTTDAALAVMRSFGRR